MLESGASAQEAVQTEAGQALLRPVPVFVNLPHHSLSISLYLPELAFSMKIITKAASERVCRYAFEYAKANDRCVSSISVMV